MKLDQKSHNTWTAMLKHQQLTINDCAHTLRRALNDPTFVVNEDSINMLYGLVNELSETFEHRSALLALASDLGIIDEVTETDSPLNQLGRLVT